MNHFQPRPRLQELITWFARHQQGATLVEFALVAPVLMIMIFGTAELANVLTVDRRLDRVASTAAGILAQKSQITADEIGGIISASADILKPYDPAPVRATVSQLVPAFSGGDAVPCWTVHYNSGSNSFDEDIRELLAEGAGLLVIEISYGYTPKLPSMLGLPATIVLAAKAFAKPRSSLAVLLDGEGCEGP